MTLFIRPGPACFALLRARDQAASPQIMHASNEQTPPAAARAAAGGSRGMGDGGIRGGALLALLLVFLLLVHEASGWGQRSAPQQDPYKVLGVERNADASAIKSAYKKLALKYHPDRVAGNAKSKKKSEDKFKDIAAAYEILSDPDRRRLYDQQGYDPGDQEQRKRQQEQHQQQHFHHQWHGGGGFHWEWRDESESSWNRAIPSATTVITASNLRTTVLYSTLPWLIQVYAEDSPACRAFARDWEALHKMAGSVADRQHGDGQQALFKLGRVNARHQLNLAHWMTNGADVPWQSLPVILAVRPECVRSECFVRLRGPINMTTVQDFVASKLLNWQPLPMADLESLDGALRRAHPAHVVALAFSRTDGQGSLLLRHLAHEQRHMMTFVRVVVPGGGKAGGGRAAAGGQQQQQQDGQLLKAWWERLGVTFQPPALVLLRGPGTTPEVLIAKPGEAAELADRIHENALMWQTIPALRPLTLDSLGCRWAVPSARTTSAPPRAPTRLCVVVVAPSPPALDAARRAALALSSALNDPAAMARAGVDAPAQTPEVYSRGELRLAWMNGAVQRAFCHAHVSAAPADAASQAGGRKDLVGGACGRSWLGLLAGDLPQAAAALLTRGAASEAAALLAPPPPRAVLLAFRPAPPGSSARGTRHLFSVMPLPDGWEAASRQQQQQLREDWQAPVLRWLEACVRAAKASGARSGVAPLAPLPGGEFPPSLVDDDEPDAASWVLDRVVLGSKTAWATVRSLVGPGADGVPPGLQQAFMLVFTFMAVVIVQMALRWHVSGAEPRAPPPRPAPSRQQPWPPARGGSAGENGHGGAPAAAAATTRGGAAAGSGEADDGRWAREADALEREWDEQARREKAAAARARGDGEAAARPGAGARQRGGGGEADS